MSMKKQNTKQVGLGRKTQGAAVIKDRIVISQAKDGTLKIGGIAQHNLVNKHQMLKVKTTPIQPKKLTKDQILDLVAAMKVA